MWLSVQEQPPALSEREKGVSMTKDQAAPVKVHKEEKPTALRPLAALPSDCGHAEETGEAVPHRLQRIRVSGLQKQQLKKVLPLQPWVPALSWKPRSDMGTFFASLGDFSHPPRWKRGLR